MRRTLGNKGFTLIELIVVIVILAVLALVAVPNVIGYIQTSRINTANANIDSVIRDLEANYAQNGQLPTSASYNTTAPKGIVYAPSAVAAGTSTYNLTITITGAAGYSLPGAQATTANFPARNGVTPSFNTTNGTVTYTSLDAAK